MIERAINLDPRFLWTGIGPTALFPHHFPSKHLTDHIQAKHISRLNFSRKNRHGSAVILSLNSTGSGSPKPSVFSFCCNI
ncbi:hypothetical protein, partial [Leptospira borgpetersenii]|uniref:hypothetical protein n=1 Tax=Leptospira borgpetersenii TaxID=174 RepID=UPI001D139245